MPSELELSHADAVSSIEETIILGLAGKNCLAGYTLPHEGTILHSMADAVTQLCNDGVALQGAWRTTLGCKGLL